MPDHPPSRNAHPIPIQVTGVLNFVAVSPVRAYWFILDRQSDLHRAWERHQTGIGGEK